MNRAYEVIERLQAEIVKRDARISGLETELEETLVDWGTLRLELASLKSKQQRGGVAIKGMADALRHVTKELDAESCEDIDYAQVSGALSAYELFGASLNTAGECVAVDRELLLRIAIPATTNDKNDALAELRDLFAQQGKAGCAGDEKLCPNNEGFGCNCKSEQL